MDTKIYNSITAKAHSYTEMNLRLRMCFLGIIYFPVICEKLKMCSWCCLFICCLAESHINIRHNFLYAAFKAKLGAVETQIIVPGISPVQSGIILVIIGTMLVDLLYIALQFPRTHALLLCSLLHTIFMWCMDEYA